MPSPSFTPEQSVVLAAIRVDAAADTRVRDVLPQPLDWTAVVETARLHGVLSLLYRSLQNFGRERVPEEAWTHVRDLHMENAARSFRMTRKLLSVVGHLGRHNIRAVPYKGPALAVEAYGDLFARQFVDIDVLIDPRDLDAVYEWLPSVGFNPVVTLSERQRRRLKACRKEAAFSDGEDLLEVQWSAGERHLRPPFGGAEIVRAAVASELEGVDVLSPPPEVVLTLLCFHGVKHRFAQLKWVADIAHFIDAHPGLDWAAVLGRARARGVSRIVHIGLRMAESVGGVALPPAVRAEAHGDTRAGRLSREIETSLFSQPVGLGLAAFSRYFLSTRERLRDRVAYCLDLAFTPTEGDWLRLDLPGALYGLYYVTRPFRLMATRRSDGAGHGRDRAA